jgi:hypothetical protein
VVGVSEAQVTPGTVFSKMLDGNGNKIFSSGNALDVNCIVGCAGGATYLDADSIANQTVSAVHGQTYMYNGVTWDRVRGSILGGLEVNCITGCAGGSSTPTDAFANPTTAGIQQTFNMVYNGATWDRLRGTVAGGALVNISNASIAVTNAGLTNLDVALSTRASEITLGTRLAEATFTGTFVTGTLDADALANETTTAVHGKCYLYNGASWDRCRGAIATGLLVNISNTTVAVTQSGAWTVAATQSGVWSTGRTWTLSSGTDSVAVSGTVAVSNAFLLDATFTNRFPAGSTPADNESNAVTISRIGNFNYVFDGVAWDRWTGAVTGSGNFTVVQPTGTNLHIVCDSGCGGAAAFNDNSAFTFGTTGININGYVFDDVAPNAVTENNAAAPRMSGNRIPYGIIRDGAGNERGANVTAANALVVDGSAVTQPISGNIGTVTTVTAVTTITNPVTVTGGTVASANNDGTCTSGAVSFTAIVSNASRTWLAVWASPANTDDVYLKLGATATAADARFAPGQPLNFTSGRIYTGIIDAFPASGTQAVCVMELN